MMGGAANNVLTTIDALQVCVVGALPGDGACGNEVKGLFPVSNCKGVVEETGY